MPQEQNGQGQPSAPVEPDFAKAFKELAEGEKAAAAMERHLDAVEKKIEELLAQAKEDECRMETAKAPHKGQEKDTPSTN